MSGSLVLDAGALIAVERRSPRIQEIVRAARARTVSLVVPTAALAQVVRSGGRQADLRRFLADSYLRFAGLDYHAALQIGALLGEAGGNDVVDAAVVVCARELGLAPVITSDPADLRKLDPVLPLIVI
jgi:predicted nucleic acid-binding protein